MYEFISGEIVEISPAHVVLEANGIGYFVKISVNSYQFLQNRKTAKIYTELIIREDGHFLYGFATKEEREIFRMLISVSGIGPQSAVLVLSSMNPGEVREAIVSENIAALKSVKGIGPKTAKRLIVELKDKMLKGYEGGIPGVATGANASVEEAIKALEVLGYPRRVTEKVVAGLVKNLPDASAEQIIKAALKRL